MINDIFLSIGIIIVFATLLTLIVRLFRQPIIPAYILTGIVIGPVLGWITNTGVIRTLSEIGIAFLLFIVGLEIDFRKLKNVAMISSIGGIIQILLLFTFGFILASLFGIFTTIESVYLGIILAFSSTMVVVKLLSDKRELDTLHARIIVGILLLQDFAAIIALSMLSNLSLSFTAIAFAVIKVVVLLVIAFVISKVILPPLLKFAAKSQEFLFLVSVCVVFGFALISEYIGVLLSYFVSYLPQSILTILRPGLSIVIGSFIAGLILGNTEYNIEIIGKVKSLRDFFAIIFFVSLGMEIMLGSILKIILPFVVLLLFIIIIKPVVTMFICSFFGYKKRPSFLTAISLAQISEFALIIAAQGIILNHISQEIFSLTVILAVCTMGATTYFIDYEYKFYSFLSKYLNFFEKFTRHVYEFEYMPKKVKRDVILCGYNRIGYSIYRTLKKMKKKLLVIDFNPEIIKHLMKKKIPCIYGDVGDIEIIERMNLKDVEMVISTVPEKHDNLLLIKKTKEVNNKAIIFVTANQIDEALDLYDAGADYVILPHFLGGEHVSVLIEEYSIDVAKLLKTRLKHIKELHHRRFLGHEHPKHHK